jgi:hypothetical protein
MEKALGIQLFQKWDDLDGDRGLSLIKQLTELEHELASIPFPASGHLYFMESILENNCIPLHSSVDPSSQYEIGRSCDRSWNIDQSHLDPNLLNNIDPGPCKYLSSFLSFNELIAVIQGSHLLRMVERSRTERSSSYELNWALDSIDCAMPISKKIYLCFRKPQIS